MEEAASVPSIWSLRGNLASLEYGQFSGQLDIARPQAGLHSATFPCVGHRPTLFLGIHRSAESLTRETASDARDDVWWPLAVADAYVRGNDLVATYQPASEWPFAPQVYWRADALRSVEGVLGSISLLVSVQTPLLDTHPQISVGSQFHCNELLRLSTSESGRTDVEAIVRDPRIGPGAGPCCLISRLKGPALSYVEIMLPGDFYTVAPRRDPKSFTCNTWRLFSEFLEKGVIRRARLHAALVPRENDVALAAACCEAVERLALPLTT